MILGISKMPPYDASCRTSRARARNRSAGPFLFAMAEIMEATVADGRNPGGRDRERRAIRNRPRPATGTLDARYPKQLAEINTRNESYST